MATSLRVRIQQVSRFAIVRIALVLMIVLGATNSALGQAGAGITGTITDPTGAIVPGVTVTIRNLATGVTQQTTTSSAGVYAINGLISDRYTVTVEGAGFKKEVRDNIPIEIGVTSTISIQLATGSCLRDRAGQ